ncbi:MAG TPA: YbaK/EbsC family protein [Proteiniclasticum sp.]|nr:YbaK/EbsC family protein [Proteiniclasticum sp.]
MRIRELLLRTMRSDQSHDEGKIDYYMQRAGFIRKVDGKNAYTTLGMLFKERVEKIILDHLEEDSFSRIEFSGQKDLLEFEAVFHAFNNVFVGSFKDIPLQLYARDRIAFRNESSATTWKESTQNIIGFSVLGDADDAADRTMMRVFEDLGIKVVMDHEGYYYPTLEGQDEYSDKEEPNEAQRSVLDSKSNAGDAELVETFEIRSVEALCAFLEVRPDEILKTMLLTDGRAVFAVVLEGDKDVDLTRVSRIIGLKEDALKVLQPSKVMEVTGAEVGFAGPKNLKVDKILVDTGVQMEKRYIAGANKTHYHYKGVKYGRDFSGDFCSVTRRKSVSKGWLLGECRNQSEKIRVQALNGGFDYHDLSVSYLNVDRILLAAAKLSMDEIGLNLSADKACFEAVVAIVDPRDERGNKVGEDIYHYLESQGLRVLLDDRKDRMGSKFSDYDLIGIDKRVIVGRDGVFDIKDRYGMVTKVDMNNIVEIIKA